MIGPLILDPVFTTLAVLAVVIVCFASPPDLATACAIYSLEFAHFGIFASFSDCYFILPLSLPCEAILCYHLDLLRLPLLVYQLFHAWVCLCGTFYFLHHVAYLLLLEIALMYDCMCIYCYVWIIAIYTMCMCLCVQVWCTLVDYIHDANWLYYLH